MSAGQVYNIVISTRRISFLLQSIIYFEHLQQGFAISQLHATLRDSKAAVHHSSKPGATVNNHETLLERVFGRLSPVNESLSAAAYIMHYIVRFLPHAATYEDHCHASR